MGVNGIYGLSGSGLDIESMVKVGMMSKQNEYDKMAQKFTKNEWMKADYLELNSKITTFNSSTLSQYKMSNTMNAKTAESSSSAVKVSANSTAPLMNHKVEVESLSSNAYLLSTSHLKRYDGNGQVDANSDSIELKNILFSKLSLDEDNKKASYDLLFNNGSSSSDIANYSVDLTDTNRNKAISFFISDGATLNKDSAGNDIAGSFKKEEIYFTFEEVYNGATLNDLVSKINGAGLNIKASYDSVNDSFSFYNTKGGEENTISITTGNNGWPATQGDRTNASWAGTVAARFFESLEIYQSKNGVLYSPQDTTTTGTGTTSTTKDNGGKALRFYNADKTATGAINTSVTMKGENGTMIIDGVKYNDITDNKKTVNGITYTALNTTASAATVSVSQDTDSIIEKVKSFVTDYNKLLASLYEKYDEKPNSDYKPLTQSQKDQMKDEQIEKWEEKAKKGLLYHDQTLGKVIMNMRDAVSETVDGIDSKYNSIYSLGISTTGLKGQLVIDEDKLKKAMAEDPDAVYNIFAKLDNSKKDSAGNVINNPSGNGVAQRLGDIFVEANKLIKERAGSSSDITEDSDLNSLLRNLQTKMSNFKKMMNSFEDALYKKYDAMESTLAKLGTQLNFVMGNTGQ